MSNNGAKKIRKRIRLGITMGDTNGIGPELIIRVLNIPKLKEMFIPVIYGSGKAINVYKKVLRVEKFNYNIIQDPDQAEVKKISLIECNQDLGRVEIGKSTPEGGKAAFQSLERAVADLKDEKIDAIVTMPINKANIQNDAFNFPGHTEYLQEKLGAKDSLMFMVADYLKVGVVTGHIPVSEISGKLTHELISRKIKLMHESLIRDYNLQKPKIAVLGLNPHAGDNGLLGQEDDSDISRAIRQADKDGIFAMGPYPADGFFGAGTFKKFDGVLAMYHDQGLVPFKTIAGFEGVNFTAGLSHVRTSPDHGVAYEISGKGVADLTSAMNAMFAAQEIYRSRNAFEQTEANALKPEPVTSGRR